MNKNSNSRLDQHRLAENDQYKSGSVVKDQLSKNKKCLIEDCSHPITIRRGPGNNKLCRTHQLQQREYGGFGRIDRLWTFSREWTCSWCGYNPKNDPWFTHPPIPFENEVHKTRVMRSMLVGDHKTDRKVDGGSHGKSNVQTLCQNCNAKKTNIYKDYETTKFICN